MTPVVFLVFNRPDTTKKVFEAIRQAKPSKLFVIADGPRKHKPDDEEKCKMTRAIFDEIDWDCDVVKNFSDLNLGCGERVSSGLNWVFEMVEEAIILEDDCLPHPSFFQFCEELLEYYRHDERIFLISGNNFQFGKKRTEYSYYFSHHLHIWGWATWRRAWQYYDYDMLLWPVIRDNNWLKSRLDTAREQEYWTDIFERTYNKKINTWDYQWLFTYWTQNGLIILPKVNLVTNIGCRTDGTHTRWSKDPRANVPTEEMSFPLKHPPFVLRNLQADTFTHDNFLQRSIKIKIKNKLNIISKEFFPFV